MEAMTARREVSATAVEKRVRRKLSAVGETLHRVRPESRDYHNYGPYYVTDERNCVVRSQADLESFARELGVLQPWESVAE